MLALIIAAIKYGTYQYASVKVFDDHKDAINHRLYKNQSLVICERLRSSLFCQCVSPINSPLKVGKMLINKYLLKLFTLCPLRLCG